MHYCPECGHDVGGEQHFCAECGAQLVPGPGGEPGVHLDQPHEPGPPRGSGPPAWIIAVVAVLGVLVVAAVAFAGWFAFSAYQTRRTADTQAARLAETNAENQRLASAVKLFNTKDAAKAHLTLISGSYGHPEVSAGWAADSGNTVVITMAWPKRTGNGSALQYVFDAGALATADSASAAVMLKPKSSDRTSLDPSTTSWNAIVDGTGNVLLDGYQAACMPSAPTTTAKDTSDTGDTKPNTAAKPKESTSGGGSSSGSDSDIYTPSRSSSARHEMMDSARGATGTGSLFIVKSLYVLGTHALGRLEQDDATHTQWLVAWERVDGTWYCYDRVAYWGTMSASDVEHAWSEVPPALVDKVLR